MNDAEELATAIEAVLISALETVVLGRVFLVGLLEAKRLELDCCYCYCCYYSYYYK